MTGHNPVIETYVALKQRYGEDILVDVELFRVTQPGMIPLIKKLNHDSSVSGIIIQLPLENPSQTDEIVDAVAPEKDVDALGKNAILDPATPMAINWLLSGYNVDLKNKHIIIVGNGRLVGKPLAKMWANSGYDVKVLTQTDDLLPRLKQSDIIVTATGKPGLITSEMIPVGAVIIDAGVASENGETVGDVAKNVYERDDLTITPQKGGVGPLTVSTLFDNVIRAARNCSS
jgi:methylenetetrahydrofolate dehydrogenase (NADP+)/methenyltetrahydrofolate cyclohydrolase